MTPETIISSLKSLVGESHVRTSPDDLKTYGDDWSHRIPPRPLAIVFPGSTEEVSRLLAFCSLNHLPVVPSGGRTGLAGAAVAPAGEVVIALDRLNMIEEINVQGLYAKVQAGVVTQTLQEAARDKGLYYPADLAAKGSCQIGGNIACNAGGLHVIRYGTLHDIVLGVEVVLASGEVLHMNKALRKDNTGYDLKHLFLGSEGTLGIITRATVRLVPPPRSTTLVCFGLDSFSRIPAILSFINTRGVTPLSFEFFSDRALHHVMRHHPTFRKPFEAVYPHHLLLEVEQGATGSFPTMDALLESFFAEGFVADGIIAQSSAEHQDLWALRENISESVSLSGPVRKCDISIAIDKLPDLVRELESIGAAKDDSVDVVLYGHIGDGNIHVNLVGRSGAADPKFESITQAMETRIYTFLHHHGGSMSAEHGIGLLKKEGLHHSRTAAEIALMRQIKKVLDPFGIMNPGKIFD